MLSSPRGRRTVFGLLCIASAAVVAISVYSARARIPASSSVMPLPPAPETKVSEPSSAATPATPPVSTEAIAARVAAPSPPRIFFRHNALDRDYGRLAYYDSGARHFASDLACETVHISAGRGICGKADRGVVTTYEALLFDTETYAVNGSIPLSGIPSRCRVSPDGSKAAFTVFVTGHSYASTNFSTQTLLIDAVNARVLGDLENFVVTQDGAPFKSIDFNFWGVTFTSDSKHFYCTLSTANKHLLVKGDVEARSAVVMRDEVECPSLSPDGTRIAYKKRYIAGNRPAWRLHVLDLTTGRNIALAEERNVDDQLEWLDNEHVLYALPPNQDRPSASTNVWIAAADGSTKPEVFLENGYSPAVAR